MLRRFSSQKEYGPLAPFLKMRRRLTVTGTSETIDGVAKLTVDDDNNKDSTEKRVEVSSIPF